MSTTQMTAPGQTEQGLFGRVLQDNPLALGLIALVMGALIALLLPETQQEHELLGPKRDQLAQQAQDTVKEIAQKVTVVAQAAGDAAHDALDKTQEAAREAITDALDTVKEEAKGQGLPVSV